MARSTPVQLTARGTRRVITIQQLMIYAILTVGTLFIVTPFLWMVSTALKENGQIFAYPPVLIPDPVLWGNFPDALSSYPFGLWTVNTLLIIAISLPGTVLSSTITAFSFARLRWPGRDVCFLIVLATMMLPGEVTMIPTLWTVASTVSRWMLRASRYSTT